MDIKKVDLGNENELIFRAHKEIFSKRCGQRIYCDSISEVLLRTNEQLFCIGLCSSNTYTGLREFVQYTPQCVLFFRGNGITNSYFVDRVFDIETMTSLRLDKDEILEKYGVELSEEIKNPVVSKKHVKRKVCC